LLLIDYKNNTSADLNYGVLEVSVGDTYNYKL